MFSIDYPKNTHANPFQGLDFKKIKLLSAEALQFISGGASPLNRAIALLIQEQGLKVTKKDYCGIKGFGNLALPVEEWGHCQYRNISCLLDISLSTIKRFVEGESHLNCKSKEKIMAFLEKEHWEDVEEKAWVRVLKKI